MVARDMDMDMGAERPRRVAQRADAVRRLCETIADLADRPEAALELEVWGISRADYDRYEGDETGAHDPEGRQTHWVKTLELLGHERVGDHPYEYWRPIRLRLTCTEPPRYQAPPDLDRAAAGRAVTRLDAGAGTAAVTAARRVAAALTLGIDSCEQEGRPLTQLQQIDMLAAALLEFDGARLELERMLGLEAVLRDLRDG